MDNWTCELNGGTLTHDRGCDCPAPLLDYFTTPPSPEHRWCGGCGGWVLDAHDHGEFEVLRAEIVATPYVPTVADWAEAFGCELHGAACDGNHD